MLSTSRASASSRASPGAARPCTEPTMAGASNGAASSMTART